MHKLSTYSFGIVFSLLLLLLPSWASAQSRTQQFNQLLDKNDTARAQVLLTQWKKDVPGDPEWYVARYNFLVWSSMKSIVTIGSNPKGNNYMEITPTDTSVDATPQFMYADVYYQPKQVASAIACIDSAIALFPDRLDLRFGKIYLLGETQSYQAFADEIVKTIHYGATFNHNWKWTDGLAIDGGIASFNESIQSYIVQLYDTNVDSLGVQIGQIATAVLQYDPNNIENLSNLAISYMLASNYEEALKPLLKAETVDPTDAIVLSNIAFCYHRINNKEQAIAYYEKSIKYGDREMKAFSYEQIQLINSEK